MDGDRLIVPRPDPAEPYGDPPAAPDDLVFFTRALVTQPAYRRVVTGGAIATMIGVPLLVAFLHATGSIEVDPAWTIAVLLICEASWIAMFARAWRRNRQ
jgi:hypothetical protein